MTDLPSAVPDVIDALVVTAGTVADTVYDGPPSTDAHKQSYLAVGWDGDPDSLLGEYAQTAPDNPDGYPYVGSTTKWERGSITCAAVKWTGDKEVKQRRDDAYALASAFDQAIRAQLRTDPAIQALIRHWWVSTGSLTQGQQEGGVVARVVFTVDYIAQI